MLVVLVALGVFVLAYLLVECTHCINCTATAFTHRRYGRGAAGNDAQTKYAALNKIYLSRPARVQSDVKPRDKGRCAHNVSRVTVVPVS